MGILDKILRAGEGKTLRTLEGIARQVNAIEDDFVAMTDEELRGLTAEYRTRIDNGESLDELLPEAFATVREAARRTLGQRHYDVQIMGGGIDEIEPVLKAIGSKGVYIYGSNNTIEEIEASARIGDRWR